MGIANIDWLAPERMAVSDTAISLKGNCRPSLPGILCANAPEARMDPLILQLPIVVPKRVQWNW